MILKYGGIHKRLGLIIQKSGGYDEEFYITTLAKELQLDRETVGMLFKEAPRHNLSHYINLLKQGVPAEKVFDMVYKDRQFSNKQLGEVLSTFGIIAGMNHYQIH